MIPFIIPNFNQLSFLRNIVNQILFYYPDSDIYVVDNGSNYAPLLDFYNISKRLRVFSYPENDFIGNLSSFITYELQSEYYVITDPDISILPTTPPNFLEVFKAAIDSGFHHAGFGLKTDDLPEWNPKSKWIQGDENALLSVPVTIAHEGKEYKGFRAPIDTTFALYKKSNGWSAPMTGEAWNNSVRLFEAYHLTWYLHKDYLNKEMKYYFETAKRRELGKPTAGQNHYNPFNGME